MFKSDEEIARFERLAGFCHFIFQIRRLQRDIDEFAYAVYGMDWEEAPPALFAALKSMGVLLADLQTAAEGYL